MKHSLLILLALSLTALALSKANQVGGETGLAGSDQQFVTQAIQGNRVEVELGKMVASKTTDPSVKQFAEMMVKDHAATLHQFQQLAQQKSISVPQGIPPDAQGLRAKLQGESGKEFDKTYMAAMVKDHEKDIQEYMQASQDLKDPELKQLAGNVLPKLQEHLRKAQEINQQLSGGKPSPSSYSR